MPSLMDKVKLVWMDGEMLPAEKATVSVLTHTLHYGTGVFEGIRAYDTPKGSGIFRLKEHLRRLFNSIHILGIDMPYTEQEAHEAVLRVVRENELGSCYIRPLVYLSADSLGLRAEGLKTRFAIAAWEWGSYLGEEALKTGISMATSSFARHHVNVSMCRGKITGHYVNSFLAVNQALADGYHEALLLDVDGLVAEGAGENVFVVKDGVIYTPELTSALDGITRMTVFRLAEIAGHEVRTCRLTRDDIYVADEAFLVGTAAEVTPVARLDRRKIGAGGRGPVTEKIQKLYFDSVHGAIPELEGWITYVGD